MNQLKRTMLALSILGICGNVLVAQDEIPLDDKFPDGISPSHVFSKMDLLDRCLVAITKKQLVPTPAVVREIEKDLQPLHVYQTVLSCVSRLQELDERLGVFAVPTISARPTQYAPRDVLFVVDIMLSNVKRIATSMQIAELPTDEIVVTGKTPTDVYGLAIRVYLKLNSLCGNSDLSPNEVFAQMVRAVDDAKSMLRQSDPACRYRIDSPAAPEGSQPSDVFAQCLKIRHLINTHRDSLGMQAVPVPERPGSLIRPADVFFQTQIIIGEMNLLKLQLKTVSSTPLPIPVRDKTPTDVLRQANMLDHLLKQIRSGNERQARLEAQP